MHALLQIKGERGETHDGDGDGDESSAPGTGAASGAGRRRGRGRGGKGLDEDGELHIVPAVPAGGDEVVASGLVQLHRVAPPLGVLMDRVLLRAPLVVRLVHLDDAVIPRLVVEHWKKENESIKDR